MNPALAPESDHRFGWWRSLDLVHNGTTFLRRRGLDFHLFGIYLHRVDGPDPGLDLHDHPWPFITLVLRGGYREAWSDTRKATATHHEVEYRMWGRWSVHRMPLTVAHSIDDVTPGTITLVARGRKSRRWGFYMPHGWVDFEDYDYAARRPMHETRT